MSNADKKTTDKKPAATTKAKTDVKPKTVAETKKDEKKAKENSRVDQIFKVLSASKKGLMATEIGAKIGLEDAATVRRLTRSAGKKAEKEGLEFIKENVEGNKKSYRIAKKA